MRSIGNKFLGRLLLLILILHLMPVTSFAADSPVLSYTPMGGEGLLLSIDHLEKEADIYAVQLELTFSGAYSDAKFSASDTATYQPKHDPEVKNGNTYLTVYIVNGNKPLNKGRTLTLGTLSMGREQNGNSFVMPDTAKLSMLDESLRVMESANGVTVQTQQKEASGSTIIQTPDKASDIELPFTDVQPRHWFYKPVQFVYEKNMMSGMTETTFAPDVATTRGMIVTILYRLEGSPAVKVVDLADVPANRYYAKAIAWASEKGIVSGYPNGTFAPEQEITREQMASILYRYAQYKGYDTTDRAALSGYTDVSAVSDYALTAMRWVNGAGIISGVTDTTLVPKGNATRAQIASILMRFDETIK